MEEDNARPDQAIPRVIEANRGSRMLGTEIQHVSTLPGKSAAPKQATPPLGMEDTMDSSSRAHSIGGAPGKVINFKTDFVN